MLKLIYGSKNKLVKIVKPDFQELLKVVAASFQNLPIDYSLSYLDTDGDQICLNSDEDISILIGGNSKVYKIYIKQGLSEAFEIDPENTSMIQPNFELSTSSILKSEKQEFVHEQPKPSDTHKVEQKESQILQIKQAQTYEAQKDQVKVQFKVQFPLINCEVLNRQQLQQQKNREEKLRQYNRVNKDLIKTEYNFFDLDGEKPSTKAEQLPKKDNKIQAELVVHEIICSHCFDQFGIVGVRYQCIFCQGFNICQKCEPLVDHQHALLKVKRINQAVNKEQIIQKFRKEIQVQPKPILEHIPSIYKEQIDKQIETAKQSLLAGYEKSKAAIDNVFTKLKEDHTKSFKNLLVKPPKPEDLKEKAGYLMDIVGINIREAHHYCKRYLDLSKQQIVELYIQTELKL